jgi:RNA polymerase-binding transcription factor DksA
MAGQPEVAELLAAQRAVTLQRIDSLQRDFTAIVDATGSSNTDDEHDPEGATIAFERQHIAALLAQSRDRLTQIDASLRKLAEGTYGRCETCSHPIAPARLAAQPAATTCITCASRH